MSTVSAKDVAAYILRKMGAMTTMKLQKLLYYCQAWSLVWDEAPLFDEKIEAWASGPVVKDFFKEHRTMFTIASAPGDPSKLSAKQIETIDSVLDYYGDKSSQWLSDLTHMEDPWKDARGGLPPGERSNREIPLGEMMLYYSSL